MTNPRVTRLIAIKENLTELRSIPSIAADLVAALLVEEALNLTGQELELALGEQGSIRDTLPN